MPQMKKTSAEDVAELLRAAVQRSESPTLLHDRAALVALDSGYAEDLNEALELVEPLLDGVKIFLARAQASAEKQGISWSIELFGSEDEFIRGSSFEDLSLAPVTRRVRANRAHVEAVKAGLIALTFTEFEVACTSILRLIGCKNPKTSPLRDDGGIDFYGRLELKGRLDATLPYGGIDGRVGIWLIGQAKHYPTNPVGTAHLRELVGSVELARTGGAIHEWDGLGMRPFDATLQLIFTTGRFSSGAHQLLSQSGMLAMDGEQLATFLCDANVGFEGNSSDFELPRFRQTLLG